MAREAIGPNVELMVDANGAYGVGGRRSGRPSGSASWDVVWLEEPLSNDDRAGLRGAAPRAAGRARRSPPASTTGASSTAERLLAAGAVDVLQADVTRCGGFTELLPHRRALPRARRPVLGPLRAGRLRPGLLRDGAPQHLEYFHDHVRIESMLFEGNAGARTAAASSPMAPARHRPRALLRGRPLPGGVRSGRHVSATGSRRTRAPSLDVCAETARAATRRRRDRSSSRSSDGWRRRWGARFASTPAPGRCTPTTRRTSARSRSASSCRGRVEDIVATHRACAEFGAPIMNRGGGTSLSGRDRQQRGRHRHLEVHERDRRRRP